MFGKEERSILGVRLDSPPLFFEDNSNKPDDRALFKYLGEVYSTKNNAIICLTVRDLLKASVNKEIRDYINNAYLVLSVSPLINRAYKFLYGEVLPTITENIFFSDLLLFSHHQKSSFFIFGSEEGKLFKASDRIRYYFQNIRVIGVYPQNVSSVWMEKVLEGIRKASPNFLMLYMPFAKSIRFLAKNKNQIRANFYLPAKSSLDIYSGKRLLPPNWMEKANLGWLFNFITNPFCIFGIFTNIYFILAVIFSKYFGKKKN